MNNVFIADAELHKNGKVGVLAERRCGFVETIFP